MTVAELADCARQINHKFEVTMPGAITQPEMEGEIRGIAPDKTTSITTITNPTLTLSAANKVQ